MSSASTFWKTVRDPRIHWSVDFNAKKEVFSLMNLVTSSYRSPVFSAIFSATNLWKIEHSGPITPFVVKISGVNVPCSTSMTLRLYWRFFSCSCFFNIVLSVVSLWLLQSELVIRTSKNAFWLSLQNPFALTSSRASGRMFAERWKVKPSGTGWRGGSICTSLQIWEVLLRNSVWHQNSD